MEKEILKQAAMLMSEMRRNAVYKVVNRGLTVIVQQVKSMQPPRIFCSSILHRNA
ncbi:hypothetical protein [Xenorhabdus cabanillasii]|uniref:Uncharacterized protein n=1 Tax=Xenorhabdus cabanillasii JM26 TaxID=1427517 RepID=W1IN35_9GAMM|nr:hypothetical protein [Xenorhabdus cabanillasii]PHM75529.1 hypothetical protein Xcab_03977 [Xenorhabdus cabanillasii JM26]CDL79849.1 hypothetical protein XCR1_1250026 [Xenorhabdus cabanillasii JM26]